MIIYSWNHFPEPHNPKAFLILILILETGMVGTFVAQDLILFFVFFEVVLLPMYFMIGVWGGEQRQYAVDQVLPLHAVRLGADDRDLPGAVLPRQGPGGQPLNTFDMRELSRLGRRRADASSTAVLVFGGMFMGFGIKVPMFPFHTWLPDAHTAGARPQGSVILAAVLLKLGTYGFVRIAIPILPEGGRGVGARGSALLAVIGIIYGALGCLAQTDMKRLIAFSSVAHMGYVMLGIATLTDVRHQRRHLRHGRPRPHHRDALLHRRLGEGALPHARDQAARRPAAPGAPHGLDPRLLLHGVARPARPGRVLG